MPDPTKADPTATAIRDVRASLDGWGGLRVSLWKTDVELLLDRIAELEGTDDECRFCLGPLSLTGNAGEQPWACEDDCGLHCADCCDRCPACRYEGQDRTSLGVHDMLGGVR